MGGAQTLPSGCKVSAILCLHNTAHDHVASRMEPVASVQLVQNEDAFVVPIGDLTVRPYQVDFMFHGSGRVFFFFFLKSEIKNVINMYT